MGERIQHGMMGVDAGEAILLQLLGHNVDNLLHPAPIIRPIANDLQTMRQIAVRIGKVRLQLERRPIALNRLGNVAAVLVHAGEVAVGVGKGRVDLDGPCVALQRALDVVHLLEGVAHVAVGVGERRLDPEEKGGKILILKDP
jgi:hypothetical protein